MLTPRGVERDGRDQGALLFPRFSGDYVRNRQKVAQDFYGALKRSFMGGIARKFYVLVISYLKGPLAPFTVYSNAQ
jgi:hypothetical protein